MDEGCIIPCGVLLFIALILAGMVVPCVDQARERANRQNCADNLRQIGRALKLYSSSYNDKFPGGPGYAGEQNNVIHDSSGAGGLELLRANDFLGDYGVYICPSTNTKAGTGNVALSYGDSLSDPNTNATYAFVGGMIDGDSAIWGRADSMVAADFVGNDLGVGVGINGGNSNHTNFGNILYLAGNVTGYTGAGWFNITNAGYPNIEKDLNIMYCPAVPNGFRDKDGKSSLIYGSKVR